MVINTNTNAVEAASSLQRSSKMLSRSLARLSSGSRIVDPSDDAAGLAVSEKLEAQNARVQAARTNSQNAMSMLQTMDGFLQSMVSTLNRMSELSMMAQDITKNDTDRNLYETEFLQLKDQLRNIIGNDDGSGGTVDWTISGEPLGTFNGISLFGPRGDQKTVIGETGDQTMTIKEMNLRDSGLDLYAILQESSPMTVYDSAAIRTITGAIDELAGKRSEIGSMQSRLEFVEHQLVVQSQNLEAANSRIRDVDVAEESTRLAKYQILVQSGTSMLTQANSMPENVLRLLG